MEKEKNKFEILKDFEKKLGCTFDRFFTVFWRDDYFEKIDFYKNYLEEFEFLQTALFFFLKILRSEG